MTTQRRKSRALLQAIAPKKVDSTIRSFKNMFLLGGVLALLASAFRFYTLFSNPYSYQGLSTALNYFLIGVVFILCASLLAKRNALLVYVYGAWVIYLVISVIIARAWLNMIGVAVGMAFWVTFYVLKEQGSLS